MDGSIDDKLPQLYDAAPAEVRDTIARINYARRENPITNLNDLSAALVELGQQTCRMPISAARLSQAYAHFTGKSLVAKEYAPRKPSVSFADLPA